MVVVVASVPGWEEDRETSLLTDCCQEIRAAKVTEEKQEVNCREDHIWEVQTKKNPAPCNANGKQKKGSERSHDGQVQDVDSKGALLHVEAQELHDHHISQQPTEPNTPPNQCEKVNHKSL